MGSGGDLGKTHVGYKITWALARAVAWVLWDVVRLRRRSVLEHMAWAYSHMGEKNPPLVALGRLSYAHFIMTIFEFLTSAWRGFGHIPTRIENGHYLKEALQGNKGVYILCAHLGNWELMAYTGTQAYVPVHVVVKPIGGKRLARWVNGVRKQNGMGVIDRPKGSHATRAIFKALSEGHMVAFMADQRRKKGALVPFFGRLAFTNVGLFQLWQRRPAPIVPCAMVRGDPGASPGYTLTFFPPLVPEEVPGGVRGGPQWLAHNGALMNATLEKLIWLAPEQYFWLHKRWKGAGSLPNEVETGALPTPGD